MKLFPCGIRQVADRSGLIGAPAEADGIVGLEKQLHRYLHVRRGCAKDRGVILEELFERRTSTGDEPRPNLSGCEHSVPKPGRDRESSRPSGVDRRYSTLRRAAGGRVTNQRPPAPGFWHQTAASTWAIHVGSWSGIRNQRRRPCPAGRTRFPSLSGCRSPRPAGRRDVKPAKKVDPGRIVGRLVHERLCQPIETIKSPASPRDKCGRCHSRFLPRRSHIGTFAPMYFWTEGRRDRQDGSVYAHEVGAVRSGRRRAGPGGRCMATIWAPVPARVCRPTIFPMSARRSDLDKARVSDAQNRSIQRG